VSLSEGPNGEFEPARRPSAKKSATRRRSTTAPAPEPPRWQPAYYGGFQPEPEPTPAPAPVPPTEALAIEASGGDGMPPVTEPPDTEPRRPLSTRVRAGIAGLALLLGLAGMLTYALRPGRQVVNPIPAAETPVPPAAPGAAPPAPPPAALPSPPGALTPPAASGGPRQPALAPKAPPAPGRPPAAGTSEPHLTIPTPRRPADSTGPARHAPAGPQARTQQPPDTGASDSAPDRHADDGDKDRDDPTRSPHPPRHDDETSSSGDFLDILGPLQNVLPGLG
jgi:filamentous hemagglutinin